jgi:hypothetical protein
MKIYVAVVENMYVGKQVDHFPDPIFGVKKLALVELVVAKNKKRRDSFGLAEQISKPPKAPDRSDVTGKNQCIDRRMDFRREMVRFQVEIAKNL